MRAAVWAWPQTLLARWGWCLELLVLAHTSLPAFLAGLDALARVAELLGTSEAEQGTS